MTKLIQLKEGNILTKVTHYQLHRKELHTLLIDVHEIINKSTKKFLALPCEFLPINSPQEQYKIYGESESEVLEKLVPLIENLDHKEIFPKKAKEVTG